MHDIPQGGLRHRDLSGWHSGRGAWPSRSCGLGWTDPVSADALRNPAADDSSDPATDDQSGNQPDQTFGDCLWRVIAIYDLANEGRNVIAETFMVFEVWFTVALIYLVLTTVLSFFATGLERYYARSRAVGRSK